VLATALLVERQQLSDHAVDDPPDRPPLLLTCRHARLDPVVAAADEVVVRELDQRVPIGEVVLDEADRDVRARGHPRVRRGREAQLGHLLLEGAGDQPPTVFVINDLRHS
jgi:hypothetical protein